MSLSRALGSVASSARSRRWPPLSLLASSFSTDVAAAPAPAKRVYKKSSKTSPGVPEPLPLKPHSELKRPSEIPFQPRVANSVQLVGTVGVPVQLQASPDGVYSAITVLVQEKAGDFPQFWIPVIFQGDLAEVAACHLKENDLVYVVGHISSDAPLSNKDAQTNIRVLAHSVNFVENICLENKGHVVRAQDNVAFNCSEKTVPSSIFQLHISSTLFHNLGELIGCSLRTPTFRHKNTGQLLLINEYTPERVLSKLDALTCYKATRKASNAKESENHRGSLWIDLIDNPHLWRDNRMYKLNKSIHPKYPDFTHKDTKQGLWLSTAPDFVLQKLDGLNFSRSNDVRKQEKELNISITRENGNESTSEKSFIVKERKWASVSNKNNKESLWKDLLENSQKWQDNRSNKPSPKYPDFKHKDTGEALWLDSSPSWVLMKLPPAKTENKPDYQRKATLLS